MSGMSGRREKRMDREGRGEKCRGWRERVYNGGIRIRDVFKSREGPRNGHSMARPSRGNLDSIRQPESRFDRESCSTLTPNFPLQTAVHKLTLPRCTSLYLLIVSPRAQTSSGNLASISHLTSHSPTLGFLSFLYLRRLADP